MQPRLEDLALPANVLSILEGFPARVPAFPEMHPTEEDNRILPGGPSSSELLRQREEGRELETTSLVNEVVRVRQKADAATLLLEGIAPMSAMVASALTSLSTIPASGMGATIDFFTPGSALTVATSASIENLYGQVTLPYARAPQSQLRRPGGYGPGPGTQVKYAVIARASATIDTFAFNAGDPQAFYAVDGRLDSSWAVPVDTATEDLLVSIVIPPALGNISQVNAVSVIPWPLYACTIKEVWIRSGNTVSTALPGWTLLSLAGQLNYDSSTQSVIGAGAHRLFFPATPVREVLVRLRPTTNTLCGLVNLDCFSIEFKTGGSIVIDGSLVGVPTILRAILSGLNSSSLSRLPVTRVGSEVTIDLSSISPYDSPVLTSVALIPVPAGQTDDGFDVSTFSS